MRLCLVLGFGCLVIAQPRPPLGILRAELLSWDGSWKDGILQLRLDSGIDYSCGFTSLTFFEREGNRISPGRLRPGDKLQVMSDRTSPGAKCFARRVKVVAEHDSPAQWGSVRRATEHFAPRGNVVYTGIVVSQEESAFTMRLRSGEKHRILLRGDTRFLDNGASAGPEILVMNRQVHVRAGFNPDEEMEAYQVVSGEILQPGAPRVRQP